MSKYFLFSDVDKQSYFDDTISTIGRYTQLGDVRPYTTAGLLSNQETGFDAY